VVQPYSLVLRNDGIEGLCDGGASGDLSSPAPKESHRSGPPSQSGLGWPHVLGGSVTVAEAAPNSSTAGRSTSLLISVTVRSTARVRPSSAASSAAAGHPRDPSGGARCTGTPAH